MRKASFYVHKDIVALLIKHKANVHADKDVELYFMRS
jgi:hypothetical protein